MATTDLSVPERSAALEAAPPKNGMELLAELARKTDDPQVSVAVAKAVVDLQIQMERFQWEREERQSKIDFDDARNRCQKAIGRIAPNQNRRDTNSWWADYAQLDRVIRPIYTNEGFSIGYSEVQPIHPGKVRIKGELSRGGITREFFAEITPTTTGPKGGQMATATDADAIAMARAKRYILLDMFNIAVGIDKVEKEGIPTNPEDILEENVVIDYVNNIAASSSWDEMRANVRKAMLAAGVPEEVLDSKNPDIIGSAKDKRAARAFSDARQKVIRKLKGGSHV